MREFFLWWRRERRKYRENIKLMMFVSLVPRGVLSLETDLGVPKSTALKHNLFPQSITFGFEKQGKSDYRKEIAFLQSFLTFVTLKHDQDKPGGVLKQTVISPLCCAHLGAK